MQDAALATQGSTTVRLADGTEYDLGGEWASISMYGSLCEALGRRGHAADDDRGACAATPTRSGSSVDPAQISHGKLVEELWEHLVGDDLWAPTFVARLPGRDHAR